MPTARGSQRLTDADKPTRDLAAAAATVIAAARAGTAPDPDSTMEVTASNLLEALMLLHWMQDELTAIEPALIAAARQAGLSWQTLAPALGVASRQAAERRYLRLLPAAVGHGGDTGDSRVRAARDRRAGQRAVAVWANHNTADLRRLAGQITALGDLDDDAAASIDLLHQALGDLDATALPTLLANIRRYLHRHPELADQVDSVAVQTRTGTQPHPAATR